MTGGTEVWRKDVCKVSGSCSGPVRGRFHRFYETDTVSASNGPSSGADLEAERRGTGKVGMDSKL